MAVLVIYILSYYHFCFCYFFFNPERKPIVSFFVVSAPVMSYHNPKSQWLERQLLILYSSGYKLMSVHCVLVKFTQHYWIVSFPFRSSLVLLSFEEPGWRNWALKSMIFRKGFSFFFFSFSFGLRWLWT